MKFLIAIALFLTLNSNLAGQRLITTKSGQIIFIMSDGTWQYRQSEKLDSSFQNTEIPYKPYMTDEMIRQLRLIIKETEVREIMSFMVLDSLNKEVDHKKMKISQAKRLKNKLEQKQFEKEINTLDEEIKLAESEYEKASKLVDEAKKLRFVEKEEYVKNLNKIAQGLNIYLYEPLKLPEEIAAESQKPTEKAVIKKSKPIPSDCAIAKNIIEGKKRIIEMSKEYIFSFTPEKLKSYFKDKELMVAEVAIVTENNITKLRLFQKLISKDASKNYGHIPYEALMRITLISGKKIDIYSIETSYGEVENYTGHVIYNTDFLLKDSDIKALSDGLLDTIGLMWTSGFESYVIYNLDVIMKQLSCLKKVVN